MIASPTRRTRASPLAAEAELERAEAAEELHLVFLYGWPLAAQRRQAAEHHFETARRHEDRADELEQVNVPTEHEFVAAELGNRARLLAWNADWPRSNAAVLKSFADRSSRWEIWQPTSMTKAPPYTNKPPTDSTAPPTRPPGHQWIVLSVRGWARHLHSW